MRLIAVSLALVCCPLVTSAHHASNVGYDWDNITELEGEITAVIWRNPHVRIDLSSVGEDGERELWELESAGINIVQRLGVGSDDINVGDRVRVAGAPNRRGETKMFIANALLPDGREVLLRASAERRWTSSSADLSVISAEQAAEAERLATGIFRVWSWSITPQTTVSLTEEAQLARDSWDQERDDTALRCIQQGMPGVMFSPFPIEFIDRGDEIVLRVEEWDAVRPINMSERENSVAQPSTPLGYSVGRWEGRTLVVETTRVDWPHFDSIGTPQTDAVEIMERFTLSADEQTLGYDVTVTDPTIFTAPAEISGGQYVWVPGEAIKPYNCAL
ncbi:MAG: DUF6152 family protein [Gammaproteobacteria bacterium]|jgi:hypothetical protein